MKIYLFIVFLVVSCSGVKIQNSSTSKVSDGRVSGQQNGSRLEYNENISRETVVVNSSENADNLDNSGDDDELEPQEDAHYLDEIKTEIANVVGKDSSIASGNGSLRNDENAIPKTIIELEYNKKLYNYWIDFLTNKDRERFARHMENGKHFLDIVTQIMHEEGVPSDLFYVGLIESGFNTKIKSRAQAVGPWQFIKGTARRYHLRVDNIVDERYSIFKATRAAAHYFKDLYNIFGSWELALCAYNAGEYGIMNSIRKGKTRDYQKLVEMGLLPKETVYYIPKVAAAREIFNNPSKYNFDINSISEKAYLNPRYVTMSRSFNVNSFLAQNKISRDLFSRFNPDFKRDWISTRIPIKVFLPADAKVEISSSIFDIPESEKGRELASLKPRKEYRSYRVRRGDNLSIIARRFGTSVNRLMSINNLKSKNVIVGQRLKIKQMVESFVEDGDVDSNKSQSYKVYVVKRGDNLHRISKRFNVSIKEIIAFNDMAKKNIIPGQKLKIPGAQ